MAGETVKIAGLEQLGQRMRSLSRDMNLKHARAATNAAAQVVKKQTKQNIRSRPSYVTGSLENAVIVKRVPPSQSDLTSEHIVTFRGRGKKGKKLHGKQTSAPHAHFVEFGTVNMPAEPNMRDAFEQEKGFAVQAMIGKLKAGIEKSGG